MSFRIFFWICFLALATALPQGIHIGKDGTVGASWGGYSASAGLGGLVGGAGPRGGLHAQAGTPDGHFAAAGLGGSVSEGAGPQGQLYSVAGHGGQPVVVETPVVQPAVVQSAVGQPVATRGASSQASSSAQASSGASSGGPVGHVTFTKRPGSFFDDIFNIPISTLGAVNQYLNNRQKVVAVPSGVARPVYVAPSTSFSSASSSSSSSSSSSKSGASSSADSASNAGASTGIDNNIYHGYQKNPNYNDIFNIPISVLGAVNRFLNG